VSCEERTKAMQVHKDKPLAGERVFFGTRPARRGGGAHETTINVRGPRCLTPLPLSLSDNRRRGAPGHGGSGQ